MLWRAREKEEKKKEQNRPDSYVFQLVTQSAYKRIVILIKARILPGVQAIVIATISLDAFSTLVIALLLATAAKMKRINESVKENVSGETSAEIDRDSIKGMEQSKDSSFS